MSHVGEGKIGPETQKQQKIDHVQRGHGLFQHLRHRFERNEAHQVLPGDRKSRICKPYQESGDKNRAELNQVHVIDTGTVLAQYWIGHPLDDETNRPDGPEINPTTPNT